MRGELVDGEVVEGGLVDGIIVDGDVVCEGVFVVCEGVFAEGVNVIDETDMLQASPVHPEIQTH